MILTSDGEILTNHHVVEGATSITAEVVSTGKTYTADVVGYDAKNDIAVLQLRDASGLDTLTIDSTSTVHVGDMDTAASSGTADVVGFAIPIGTALSIADRISAGQESGTVEIGYPAFLGVEVSSSAGLPGYGRVEGNADPSGADGAVIAGTVDGSPAPGAGIAAGDTITALGDTTISSAEDLSAVAAHQPGETVRVAWVDASGSSQTSTVTLDEGPVS